MLWFCAFKGVRVGIYTGRRVKALGRCLERGKVGERNRKRKSKKKDREREGESAGFNVSGEEVWGQ